MNQQKKTNKAFESKLQEVFNYQRVLSLVLTPLEPSVHLRPHGIASDEMVSVNKSDYDTLIWLGIDFIDTGWSFRYDEWKCAFFAARSDDEIDRVVEDIILLFRILGLRIVLKPDETYTFIEELSFSIRNMTLTSTSDDDELLEHLALMFSHWANRNFPFSEVSILQPYSKHNRNGDRNHADFIFTDIISVLFSREQQQKIEPVGFDENFGNEK